VIEIAMRFWRTIDKKRGYHLYQIRYGYEG